jgi:hypothetical protein
MVKITYRYSFLELSGKPKRFIESKPECTIKGYGVSTDTVTLCVLFSTSESYKRITTEIELKFKIKPFQIVYI